MPGLSVSLQTALADRYRIERELGQGGMATVYLARDLRHDRNVAIKVLRQDLGAALGAERFLSEIKTTAKLRHPHILPLYDSGEAGGLLFYVMPLVEGESLRDRMDRDKALPLPDALRIAREVADALAHAHARDVVHRDIKPENILLEGDHALVADFGIARALSTAQDTRLTQAGLAVGTPAYMSPEQASGDEVDGRSDLYSLACVLFEMLTGEPPFAGATAEAILVQRFTQAAPRVSTRRTEVPGTIDTALSRAMARNPSDRFGTMARFADALVTGSGRADAAADDKSIAVLPFENMSSDKENEYLGDGIAEEVINALTQLGCLRVAARTSAFAFRGRQEDLRAIGEKLNVATVLEGSIRRAGNRIRVTAQLIKTADGYHMWSGRYDRELTDIFAVQDEIAEAITAKLRVTLDPGAEEKPSRPGTSNVEAYELCLKGRALANQRGRAVLDALHCFEQAVALDPNYAAAYAGLADCLRLQAQYGFVRAVDVMPRAKTAITRALELDPDSPEALDTRATISITYDYAMASAMADWERALALNPMLTSARLIRAFFGYLCCLRRFDEAVAEARLGVANDPLNAIAAAFNALVLGHVGHRPEALAEARRSAGLDPGSFIAHFALTQALAWVGEYEESITVARRALAMSGRHPWVLGTVVQVYVMKGDSAAAQAAWEEINSRARLEYVQKLWVGYAAMALGKVDEGMDLVITSARDREATGPGYLTWPGMEAVRRHRRYPELAAILGLQ